MKNKEKMNKKEQKSEKERKTLYEIVQNQLKKERKPNIEFEKISKIGIIDIDGALF